METTAVGADIHITDEVLQDLTECQGNDRQIVAPQTQDGDADKEAHHTGQDAAADHGTDQTQNIAVHATLQKTRDNDTGEGANAHETGMTQTQLTADTDQQVQGNRQDDIAANRNQITGDGAFQHAHGRQGLHDDERNDDHQIGQGTGAGIFVFQNILHNTHLTPFPGPAYPADRQA